MLSHKAEHTLKANAPHSPPRSHKCARYLGHPHTKGDGMATAVAYGVGNERRRLHEEFGNQRGDGAKQSPSERLPIKFKIAVITGNSSLVSLNALSSSPVANVLRSQVTSARAGRLCLRAQYALHVFGGISQHNGEEPPTLECSARAWCFACG